MVRNRGKPRLRGRGGETPVAGEKYFVARDEHI